MFQAPIWKLHCLAALALLLVFNGCSKTPNQPLSLSARALPLAGNQATRVQSAIEIKGSGFTPNVSIEINYQNVPNRDVMMKSPTAGWKAKGDGTFSNSDLVPCTTDNAADLASSDVTVFARDTATNNTTVAKVKNASIAWVCRPPLHT